MLNKLVIVGVGLIGGSFALALKKAGYVRHVVGVGRSEKQLKLALQLKVIDAIETDLKAALSDADLVLIAAPVGQTENLFKQIAPHLTQGTVVTDAGSTKQNIAALAHKCLANHLTQFVPGHPIAGAEQSGVSAARADLFENKTTVLTPMPENDAKAIDVVSDAWNACGAMVKSMTPQQHDSIFAAVSHLPHLLAFTLVNYIAQRDDAETLFDFAASGFKDSTRIAGSSPEMWRDICVANRNALLKELTSYQRQLARMHELIDRSDASGIEAIFERAKAARQKYLKR